MDSNNSKTKINRKRRYSKLSITSSKSTTSHNCPKRKSIQRNALKDGSYRNSRKQTGHNKQKPEILVKRDSKISQHENDSEDSDCVIVEWKSFPCKLQNKDIMLKNVGPNETDRSDQPSSVNTNPTNCNQEAICAICLKNLNGKKLSSTVCGHVFCTACITSVVKRLKYCPTCRKRLNLSRIHPLYI
ncbi:hypothetical protein ILUMI_07785 [Ignelater luminosus]|uniref:RING-type domain-containing protein n=1 Tax=Ignelater luminosus TaxID=2038154 RepID=A0A8K0D7D5_IGNLU|nr:hypothetical protein ILUMI_07785 [Ignelater luminosus]